MDSELRQHLRAIIILLSLIIGFQATDLLVSAVSMSVTFFIVPVVFAIIVGGAVGQFTGILN
jgi:hypothetical protein